MVFSTWLILGKLELWFYLLFFLVGQRLVHRQTVSEGFFRLRVVLFSVYLELWNRA